MLRPETIDDLIALLRQNNLVEAGRLEAFVERARTAETDDALTPAAVLKRLANEGLLNPYQVSALAAGQSEGFHFGAYRVLGRLGRGGMGQVYLCDHSPSGRRVAVKVLTTGLQADPAARRRFAREARAAAALDHPNVVRILDFEAEADPPFLVMEYIDGTSWQAAVVRYGPFAPEEAAQCGARAACGLQAVADAGLIHRDVKPANLLIDRRGGIKLLDLGIVRVDGEATLSAAGSETILGTIDYLAPEQALDSTTVDARADLYALGATLYFLLAGHPPFPDGEPEEKVALKMATDPTALDRLRPDVPTGLAAVIHRLLARHPKDRYATPAAAAAALLPWADLPADFPARLFPPVGPNNPIELGFSADDSEGNGGATPACATRRIVRSARTVEVARPRMTSVASHEGGIDFDAPSTSPVRIAGADLVTRAARTRGGMLWLVLGVFGLIALGVLAAMAGRAP